MKITILSWKGGVGKSTIAQNLLVFSALAGHSTALIDADNNKSSLSWYGYRPDDKPLPKSTVVGNTDKGSIVRMVQDLADNYENIIIDCPPIDSAVTTRALLAADICLIPIAPSGGGDLWATQGLFDHIQLMQEKIGRKIHVYVLINRFKPGINLHADYIKAMKEHEEEYDIKVLDFEINERISFGYANVEGLSVLEGTDQKAIKQFNHFAKTILGTKI
jgi:chromosome partitioning protein